MTDLFQTSIDGLMLGASYALIALGFALVFGIMKKINLAYGSSLLLAASISVWLNETFALSIFVNFLTLLIFSVIINIYIERMCFAWHTGSEGILPSMIASFAIWMQLDELAFRLIPDRTHFFEGIELGSIEIGQLFLKIDALFHFAVAISAMFFLYLIMMKSKFGLLMRAASENANTAWFLGARISNLGISAFALAGFLGGLAAFLILSGNSQITPMFGMWCTFKGLVAMMLGGVGSLIGAVVGGLILGLLEAFVLFNLGVEFRDLATFGVLFLILIIRPGGLLGGKSFMLSQEIEERV